MKVLTLGGTGFIGSQIVRQLVQKRHQVAVFHRGETTADLSPEIQYIRGDRSRLADYKPEFERLAPEVVVDAIAYTESDAQNAIATFKDIARRVVTVSSQDVYRARDILWRRETNTIDPVPLTEDAPLRTQFFPYQDIVEMHSQIPPNYEKILVERAILSEPSLPGTIVRLPMVYGEGDYLHRFYPYLKRMEDRRKVIVLEEGLAQWRGSYGYVENVAAAIALNPQSKAILVIERSLQILIASYNNVN